MPQEPVSQNPLYYLCGLQGSSHWVRKLKICLRALQDLIVKSSKLCVNVKMALAEDRVPDPSIASVENLMKSETLAAWNVPLQRSAYYDVWFKA
jgi:hypothetical protein